MRYNKDMEKTTKKLLKGKEIDFCALTQEIVHNDYMIVAIHDKKQVGYCNFMLINGTCRLNRIAVTDEKYLGSGVGNFMFRAMENIAYRNNAKYITAIFIPRGYDNAWQITEEFYKKQGMVNDYGEQYYCDRDEISKHVKAIDEQYDIPVVEDNNLYKKAMDYNYSTYDIFSSNHRDKQSDSPSMDM